MILRRLAIYPKLIDHSSHSNMIQAIPVRKLNNVKFHKVDKHMNFFVCFILFLFPAIISAESSQHLWGGTCSFRGESITYIFSSRSGDATNDDMFLTIGEADMLLPKGMYLRSNSYFQGKKNLCSGGVVAFEYDGKYIFAIVKDGRPTSGFVVFLYYDAIDKKSIDFFDPEIKLKYSSDDDGFPLIMKFEDGEHSIRVVNEILRDENTKEQAILDGWSKLKIKNKKIVLEKTI